MKTLRLTVHTLQYIMYIVQYIMYTVQFILHTSQFIMYTLQNPCTLYMDHIYALPLCDDLYDIMMSSNCTVQ